MRDFGNTEIKSTGCVRRLEIFLAPHPAAAWNYCPRRLARMETAAAEKAAGKVEYGRMLSSGFSRTMDLMPGAALSPQRFLSIEKVKEGDRSCG